MATLRLFSLSRTSIQQAAFFFALVASTATFATTTVSSRAFIEPIRAGSAALFIFMTLTWIVAHARVKREALISVAILVSLLALGVINMTARGTPIDDPSSLLMNFCLMIALVFTISSRSRTEDDRPLAIAMTAYAIFMLLITLFLGGIDIGPPPHFIMEYMTLQRDANSTITYGQGVTKFYGLAAISSSYLAATAISSTARVVAMVLVMAFIVLTVLGGARGDAAIAVLVVLFVLRNGRLVVLLALLLALMAPLAYLATSLDLSELVLIERFARISTDASVRVGLIEDALNLIAARVDCLVLGCGFNFFQDYYGYSENLYPHVVLLEFLIVFGGLITIITISFAFYGLILSWKLNKEMSLLAPLLLFFFLIGMKSGSVITSWLLMAGVMYFAGVGALGSGKGQIEPRS